MAAIRHLMAQNLTAAGYQYLPYTQGDPLAVQLVIFSRRHVGIPCVALVLVCRQPLALQSRLSSNAALLQVL